MTRDNPESEQAGAAPERAGIKGSTRAGSVGVALVFGVALVAGAFVLGTRGADSEPVAEFFRAPTPHEAHRMSLAERNLAGTALGRQWLTEADQALRSPLTIRSPYAETGRFVRPEADAVGYRVEVERGQRLEVNVSGGIFDSGDLLVDLYRMGPDPSLRPARVRSLRAPRGDLSLEPDEEGVYILRLQPKIFAEGSYSLSIRAVPAFLFPVAERDNNAVWSAFGAPREGGSRSHHGIDIFAPRGTPVLAAASAYVRRVDETPIGGKVVWLRDRRRNVSIYYAHLDSQAVSRGDLLSPGDTVGFVGNTGNARTTPPHLHFGVYARGEGPVDPFPFVRFVPTELPDVEADLALTGSVGQASSAGIRLRAHPSTSGEVLAELDPDGPFRVVGAAGNWYRVRLPDGSEGYVAERVTADTGVGRVALLPPASDAGQEAGTPGRLADDDGPSTSSGSAEGTAGPGVDREVSPSEDDAAPVARR